MKGIILAGGSGTRLYPMTRVLSKQLLPLYDKPMIYYPLSILMLADIREILIISTPRDLPMYQELLGNGSKFGIDLKYKVQEMPRGIAEAFIIGAEFIGENSVCLLLGDNIFYGNRLTEILLDAKNNLDGATIFGLPVKNPSAFGVVNFDKNFNVIKIEEKPENPKSNYAVPGLYFYDKDVVKIAKTIKPSRRGELEITAVNNEYLKQKKLKVQLLPRGIAWLDTGTPENMLKASCFIQEIQDMQGLYIACLEEIAWRKKFINDEQFEKLCDSLKKTKYGEYLISIKNNKMEGEKK